MLLTAVAGIRVHTLTNFPVCVVAPCVRVTCANVVVGNSDRGLHRPSQPVLSARARCECVVSCHVGIGACPAAAPLALWKRILTLCVYDGACGGLRVCVRTQGRFLATGQYGENADVVVWDYASKKELYRCVCAS